MELTTEELNLFTGLVYGDSTVMFGIMHGSHVCYLFENRVMTAQNLERMGAMLTYGSELVKVEVDETCKIENVSAGIKPDPSEARVIASGTTRLIEPVPMGPTFTVSLTENIAGGFVTRGFRNLLIRDGSVIPGLSRLKSNQFTNLARMLGAVRISADVFVHRKPTGKVSKL